jgi:hypothetical protein
MDVIEEYLDSLREIYTVEVISLADCTAGYRVLILAGV